MRYHLKGLSKGRALQRPVQTDPRLSNFDATRALAKLAGPRAHLLELPLQAHETDPPASIPPPLEPPREISLIILLGAGSVREARGLAASRGGSLARWRNMSLAWKLMGIIDLDGFFIPPLASKCLYWSLFLWMDNQNLISQ